MDAQYEQFLKETRDTVAGWIGNDRTKAIFSDDMEKLENAYQAYKDAIDAHVKKRDAYFESPKGKAQLRKNAQWKKKWDTYKQHPGPESEAPQHPGPPPEDGYKTELPISPLVKFWLRVKPDSLKIGDYRCLVGALHDGVTWDRGDKAFYICSDLRKEDTIVDVLYWQGICKRSNYRPLIEEARREVEKDLKSKGLLTTKGHLATAAPPPAANAEPRHGEVNDQDTLRLSRQDRTTLSSALRPEDTSD